MIRLKVTPVVGLPQFTGWSQVAESTSSASARLISVFAISGKHAGNVGRDVSDKISDFYYYDIEQLHEFVEKLSEYVEDNDCKLYFSCALINGDKSYFITKGGSVFLKRKDKAGQILFSEDGLKIISGKYTKEDTFVLTTLQASEFLNEIEQKFSQGFDVDIIITSVVPGLHSQEDSSLSAIVFINNVEGKVELSNDFEKASALEASLDFEDSDDPIQVNESLIDPDFSPRNTSPKLEISSDISISDKDKKLIINFKSFLLKVFSIIKFLLIILVSVIRKAVGFLKKINLKSVAPSRIKGRVTLGNVRRSKNLPKIIIGVVIAIIFSIILIAAVYKGKKEESQIISLLEPVKLQISLAREKLDEDPISSRDMVAQSITNLEKLKDENKENGSVGLIDDEIVKTKEFYEEISGKDEFDELNIFYDLRLVKSDYIASDIDVDDQNLVLLDSEKKQIINLNIGTKKVDVRDFSNADKVVDLALSSQKVYVLSDGIKFFEAEEGSDVQEIRGLGDSNRNAVFINAYERFVYVLSPDKRNIYRYSDDSGEFSDPIGWMRSATGLKYNEITSFSVDGDIWLSSVDGQIKRFSSGLEENFEIRGLNEQFSSNIKMFTDQDQENLYVLEPDKNRVVVLSKSGDFQREIKSISLASATSIAANEALGKVFVTSGSIIFEIDI